MTNYYVDKSNSAEWSLKVYFGNTHQITETRTPENK